MSYETSCIRAAMALIRTMGHCQGANARDERGRVCAASAPRARAVSIYGALTRTLNLGDVELQTGSKHRDLWAVLTQAAADRLSEMGLSAAGQKHPVFYLNDVHGFNAAAACDFLENVAARLEKVETHVKNGSAA